MNATATPPTGAAEPGPSGAHVGGSASDACPLCGAPLHREQEWCLRCGAAARTRLAAAPRWGIPVAAVLAVVALSLGILAAALVSLAGSGSSPAAITRTVTTAATTPTGPAATGPAPNATTPKATSPTPSSAAPPSATTPAGTAPTSTAPRAPTTPSTTGTNTPRGTNAR